MRSFFHGRTETIRSASSAVRDFIDSCRDIEGSKEYTQRLLRTAASEHSQIVRRAAIGAGIDRHLYALRLLSAEMSDAGKEHEFFRSAPFNASQHWLLSTSNVTPMPSILPESEVSASFLKCFTFGPVTTDGYGLGYQILEDEIPITITSFRNGESVASSTMAECIESCLSEVDWILRVQ